MIEPLHTKLLVPGCIDTIHRKRLSPLQSEITQKKITTVVAGAGYGKTTLISQAIEDSDLDAVWYTLDVSDRDSFTFLSYLISGVRNIFPAFGSETIRKMDNPDISRGDPREILTSFVNEIDDMIGSGFFLVFDDYHSVQDSPDVKAAMEFFLDYLPPPDSLDYHQSVRSKSACFRAQVKEIGMRYSYRRSCFFRF